MADYDNVISRADAGALIPEAVSREIISDISGESAVLQVARKLPNMPTSRTRMPVLSIMPMAYFVSGDISSPDSLKKTSRAEWGNKYLDAEEVAVIVPIHESVLDDSTYDIWGEIKPLLKLAFGQVVDAAIIFGDNAPASWPDALVIQAAAAGHIVNVGDNGDLYDDILGPEGVIALIEEDGYVPNGHIASTLLRAELRGLRDANGQPIYTKNVQEKSRYALDGEPIIFPDNGLFNDRSELLISGDWKKLVYSMRQDITYKILDQAVIQDETGAIIYNLAQQDMVALRAVMRIAWQLPNPKNLANPDNATRLPFAVLDSPA